MCKASGPCDCANCVRLRREEEAREAGRLARMDETMANFAWGHVGQPMDAAAMLKLLDE